MPIDLRRLTQDLQHSDADIRILALQALTRLTGADLGAQRGVAGAIKAIVEDLSSGARGDLQHFAREAAAHMKKEMGVAYDQLGVAVASPATVPSGTEGAVTGGDRDPPDAPRFTPSAALATAASGRAGKGAGGAQASTMTREAALASLGPTEGAAQIAALISLAQVGRPEDLEAIGPFLRRKEGPVRAAAVAAAARLSSRDRLTERLAPFLEDRDGQVRSAAFAGLASAGEGAVMTSLELMLASSNVLARANAAIVLGYLKGDRAIELLWQAARDPSEPVRRRTVQAAQRHRHPQAREILKRMANDLDISICEAATAALARATEQEGPSPEGDVVVRVLSGNADTQMVALKEVEDGHVGRAADAIRRVLRSAQESLVLSQAVAALGAVGGAEDVPVIVKFLAHPNDRVRANAVEAVGVLAEPKAVVDALRPLLEDPDNRVRGNVVRALAARQVEGLGPFVMKMVSSQDVTMRLSGLWAASYLPAPESLPILTKVVNDPSAEIRKKVVEVLERMPSSADVMKLVRELTRDADISICESAQKVQERVSRSLSAGVRPVGTGRYASLGASPTAEAQGATLVKPIMLGSLDLDGAPSPDTPTDPKAKARPSGGDAAALGKTTAIDPASLLAAIEPVRAPGAGMTQAVDVAGVVAAGAAPGAAAKAGPATARGKGGKTAAAETLDGIHDRLDRELESLGRKLMQLIDTRIVVDSALLKVHAQVKRYQEELKRVEGQRAKGGIGSILSILGVSGAPVRVQQIKFSLSEEIRKLGETAVELYYGEDKRFAGLEVHYETVEGLFRRAKDLKERG